MTQDNNNIESLERAKLVTETAKIRWQELEIHFARGVVIYVSPALDLVDVAFAVSRDDTEKVTAWIDDQKVLRQFDEQAEVWADEDAVVWCVVVKPWVLVQPLADTRKLN